MAKMRPREIMENTERAKKANEARKQGRSAAHITHGRQQEKSTFLLQLALSTRGTLALVPLIQGLHKCFLELRFCRSPALLQLVALSAVLQYFGAY